MKKINILLATLAVVSLSGCSDFLAETPDNRTELDSAEKISELLVNAYSGQTYIAFAETMSDNAGDSGREDLGELQMTTHYTWGDYNQGGLDTPVNFWDANYNAIAHSNQALEAIELLADQKALAPQRGEALLTRAYAHFLLVNIFSQSYDPATASSELGIPYVKDVEKNLLVNYKRLSIQEVYDLIEKDLLEGIENVQDKYKKPGFHFTRAAARAFAVKFYQAKGDWDSVLKYSDDLGDFPNNKLRNLAAYAGSALSFDAKGERYASQGEQGNLLVVAGNAATPYQLARFRYGVNTGAGSITSVLNDVSKNPFGKQWSFSQMWLTYGRDLSINNKFYVYFIYEGSNTQSGLPFVATVALSNDEMYLARIEATVMKGDLDKAAKMLGHIGIGHTRDYSPTDAALVTKARILAMYPSATEYEPFYTLNPEQQKFIKYIAEFRRRILVQEGARWFDVKRYNLEVIHSIKTGSTRVEHKLEKKDKRKAVQLPAHVSQYGVVLNPR